MRAIGVMIIQMKMNGRVIMTHLHNTLMLMNINKEKYTMVSISFYLPYDQQLHLRA